MGCYYTLCHNTYVFSLLYYKVYMKRENAGSWNSGLEKEQILETYSAQLQKSWNFTEHVFGINKNIRWRKYQRGATSQPQGWRARPRPCGPPGRPPTPIFCYIVCFDLEKIRSKLLGRSAALSRRNLGRTNLGLRRSCSAGETSLQEGEIIAIVITIDPLIERGQHPSTSSPAPSPLKP